MKVEDITARQYLVVADSAVKNGADKPRFKELSKELKRFPRTRDRLAFEFLDLATHCVKCQDEPARFIGLAAAFSSAMEERRRREFSAQMEAIIVRYFETLPNQSATATVTFSTGLLAIGRFNKPKLLALLNALMGRCGDSDPRRDVLVKAKRVLSRNRILDS